MKKNWTMRVALLLLALTLITSCFVSGTYAKYVTSAAISDTARVAKFGVQLTVDGSLFSKNYLKADDNTGTTSTTGITVQSSTDENVVAPGTKNGTGMTFSIVGQPEVSVKVEIALADFEDVYLKAGTYRDWTKAPYDGEFTIGADYFPLEFTLVENYHSDDVYNIYGAASSVTGVTATQDTTNHTVTVKGSLTKINEVFATLTANMTELAPNYKFNNSFTLTWEWKFEQDPADPDLMDKADTLLGNLAVDKVAGAASDFTFSKKGTSSFEPLTEATATSAGEFNLDAAVKFSITVTQVD